MAPASGSSAWLLSETGAHLYHARTECAIGHKHVDRLCIRTVIYMHRLWTYV